MELKFILGHSDFRPVLTLLLSSVYGDVEGKEPFEDAFHFTNTGFQVPV